MSFSAITGPIRVRLVRRIVALALAATCACAHGENPDRGKPVNFQGDTGGADFATKAGELKGNVVITQGTTTIRADRVVFKQNADDSLSATAYGNPMTFRQKREGSDDYYEGYAQRAVYDGQKQYLELFDHALLKRGTDEIRSNYIAYNSATDVFKAEGRPDITPSTPGEPALGARVRGVFQPQDAKAKDTKGTNAPASDPAKAKEPLPLKPDGALSGTAR